MIAVAYAFVLGFALVAGGFCAVLVCLRLLARYLNWSDRHLEARAAAAVRETREHYAAERARRSA